MTTYYVTVGMGEDDEEVVTKTMSISAESMVADETGTIEFWEGPVGSARLVAVFSPNVWMWAHLKGRAVEHEQDEE